MTALGGNALFDLVDQARDLFGSAALDQVFMDLSKNDFLTLLFVYRQREATMSQIADYLGVPANTATGVVNRLDRRGLVERTRSETDRRVVTTAVTTAGVEFVSGILRQLTRYQAAILAELSDEEVRVLLGIVTKALGALHREAAGAAKPTATRRIPID